MQDTDLVYHYETRKWVVWFMLILTIPCLYLLYSYGFDLKTKDGKTVDPKVIYALYIGMAAWTVYLLLLVYAQFFGLKDIRLSKTALLVPRMPWSKAHMVIPYSEMASLHYSQIKFPILWVSSSLLKKQGVARRNFANEKQFADFCEQLSQRSGLPLKGSQV